MNGWIATHRKIRESDLWLSDEPFCPRSAWWDILLSANWQDRTWHDKTRSVKVPRGSMITSILGLSERWKWSRGKVSRFLARLVESEMISIEQNKKAEAKWTLISVRNYDEYQRVIDSREVNASTGRTLDEHWTDTGKTLDGHWTDTPKQRNNITKKQEKREKAPAAPEAPAPEVVKIGKFFSAPVEAYKKVLAEFGREKLTHYIKAFNAYIDEGAPDGTAAEKNPRFKKFKNHVATVRAWERRDFAEGKGFHKTANGVYKPAEAPRPRPIAATRIAQTPAPEECVTPDMLPAEVQEKLKRLTGAA